MNDSSAKRMIVLVSTNILRIRLEKLLPEFQNVHIEFNSTNKIKYNTLKTFIPETALIIIDLDYSETDFEEVILELRKIDTNSKIPIIVLGNSGDVASINKAVTSGCTDFILKPFEDETLLKKVQRLFDPVLQSQSKIPDSFVRWNTDYRIGVKAIDEEHKQIIDHFAKLYTLMKEGHGHDYYQEMMNFLINYVQFHFDNEESFQKQIGYPEQAEHHKIHESYKNRIVEIFENQRDRPVTDDDLIKINLYIKNFVTHHILVEDLKIGLFYNDSL